MKRDMELVRRILMAIEDDPSGHAPRSIEVDGYDQQQIGYHVFIMIEADLLKGVDMRNLRDVRPQSVATRMTWYGHDFLDAAREPNRWKEAKSLIEKIGGASIQVWTSVLTQCTMKALGIQS